MLYPLSLAWTATASINVSAKWLHSGYCVDLMLRPLAKCLTELGGTPGSLLRSVLASVAVQPDGTMVR